MRIQIHNQLSLLLILLRVNVAYGQNKMNYDFERIEDNSFLIEEAYNQEAGGIQHISTFEYLNDQISTFSLTIERLLLNKNHQIPITIPSMNMNYTAIDDI